MGRDVRKPSAREKIRVPAGPNRIGGRTFGRKLVILVLPLSRNANWSIVSLPSDSSLSDLDSAPDWAGWWRVVRYGGEEPDRPTYYDATPESWDVVKADAPGPHVARHPILEVRGDTLVLKDEGEPDAHAERWRVEVEENRLRVTAVTGPHAGATGVAEPIDTDPRELASE